MSLRIAHGLRVDAPGAWNHTHPWYLAARVREECSNPETPARVAGCYCRLCTSRLTDPALVGTA